MQPHYIFDTSRENANEEGCKAYNNPDDAAHPYYKPEGVLQQFGIENSPQYKFGLLSGSYQNNLSGGVLRKQVSALSDEINSNGTLSAVKGIIRTIDALQITGFNTIGAIKVTQLTSTLAQKQTVEAAGSPIVPLPMVSAATGATPLARCYLRRCAILLAPMPPVPANDYGNNTVDAGLGLPKANWNDPFAAVGGFPWCSPAYNLILSDINPSYDGDEIPTTAFTA